MLSTPYSKHAVIEILFIEFIVPSIHIGLKAVFKLRFDSLFERGGHIERAADFRRLFGVISRFKGKIVCRAETFTVIELCAEIGIGLNEHAVICSDDARDRNAVSVLVQCL